MIISFVIPVYKSYHLLDRCIGSIVKQKGQVDVEIIIVDDTPHECREKINVDSPDFIKVVVNHRNMGVTYSRNKGWFYASGEYVIFLDSDDQLIDGALKIIENELLTTRLDCYFFRTINTSNKLVGKVLERKRFLSISSIIETYGTGERLLCIKRTNMKPFIGYFRGHEFAGLLRYISKFNRFVSLDAGYPARIYYSDNIQSISKGGELKKRTPQLINGHIYTAMHMLHLKRYILSLSWLLRVVKAKYL
ncbi:glycosyltransferase family 2 protein [Aeromonas allosaccharophila]|uniref:glycosyltransferase family 2 protein n=1 Tax=Aeromonas allosaccharophila TaxID=656 RepID=UPI001BCB9AA0|nr:glycosyltransferase family 2 protein [Aeromonas allosaccharophila]MBS4697999.1 glycosyltransferase family 2 protein [Aeromonas allosaccharophila]